MGGPELRPLLPLQLEGRGTRDVEALPSYLSRLAAAHGVTPGGLFVHLLNGYEGGATVGKALAAQPFSASVRPNATAERAIEVLCRGGCEDADQLRRSTFLSLSPALARSPNAYSRRLRWCPGCFYEQGLCGTPSYLKLSWFLEDVKVCDIHRVALRDTCPHCKRTPRPWTGWPSFSTCPRCMGPLDIVSSCDRIDLSPEAAAPDLVLLVAAIASRSYPLPAGSVNRYVNKVFDEAWASEREVALWAKLPRDECLRYAAPEEPITLVIARRIAFRLEVPLIEILDSDPPAIQSFAFASEAPLPSPMQPGRKSRTIDRVALAKNLKAILRGPAEPVSLPQIARRLSVSVGAIRYHCPGLAAKVVTRHLAFKQAEVDRQRSEAAEAARATIVGWAGRLAPLTKKAVLRELLHKTGLPKNLLIAEIRARWRG